MHMRSTYTIRARRVLAGALVAAMLFAAHGCAFFRDAPDADPIAPEPAETAQDEARDAEPSPAMAEKKKDDPAAPETTDDGKRDIRASPEPRYDKGYTLDAGDKQDLGLIPEADAAVILEGEGPYPTSSDLQMAADDALTDGRVLGDIAAFDAFPAIPGEDTVGQVFREKGQPGTRIKLFAFHAPGQEFHRLIYGYVVEDTVKGEAQGYFDENLDGIFERVTLQPYIKPAALYSQESE